MFLANIAAGHCDPLDSSIRTWMRRDGDPLSRLLLFAPMRLRFSRSSSKGASYSLVCSPPRSTKQDVCRLRTSRASPRLAEQDRTVVTVGGQLLSSYRILTARAARRASTVSEMIDCTIISSLAHCVSAGVSVGENAVLVLNARNR